MSDRYFFDKKTRFFSENNWHTQSLNLFYYYYLMNEDMKYTIVANVDSYIRVKIWIIIIVRQLVFNHYFLSTFINKIKIQWIMNDNNLTKHNC